MDTWVYYAPDETGTEVVTRIERDTTGRSKPDTLETDTQRDGKTVLVRREEDTHDGHIGVISIFENGELIRRETAGR